MEFGPQKIEMRDLSINTLGALIAGIIGSIVIVFLIFSFSGLLSINEGFSLNNNSLSKRTAIFPIFLSIITFIGTSISIYLTYFFLHYYNPEKYKKNIIILTQLSFYIFFIYLFFAPIYIYSGLIDYNYIMIVFLFHTIIVMFGFSLINDLLNNYRYVLVSLYGNFLGFFISIVITIYIYLNIESSSAKLLSLIFLLPLINLLQTFFKGFFEFGYYHYSQFFNQDQIGDIFYQIELEEKEALREEEEKNTI